MPDDPCAGLHGDELRHCLELQYANGCEQQKKAVTTAEKNGLISMVQANVDRVYVERGEETFEKQIGGGK